MPITRGFTLQIMGIDANITEFSEVLVGCKLWGPRADDFWADLNTWRFPKIRGNLFWGPQERRAIVYWGLYWSSLFPLFSGKLSNLNIQNGEDGIRWL